LQFVKQLLMMLQHHLAPADKLQLLTEILLIILRFLNLTL